MISDLLANVVLSLRRPRAPLGIIEEGCNSLSAIKPPQVRLSLQPACAGSAGSFRRQCGNSEMPPFVRWRGSHAGRATNSRWAVVKAGGRAFSGSRRLAFVEKIHVEKFNLQKPTVADTVDNSYPH